MRNRAVSAVLACVVLPLLAGLSCAETLKMPLYKFTSARRMDLKCVSSEYGIAIPIPERWNVKKAVLSFGYANSTALLPGTSRMVVRLNGDPVRQINLNPDAPEGFVRADLPARLFRAGYNDLVFSVQQHYSTGCEYPCQPELWTTLRLGDDDAMVELEYELKKVPLKLSAAVNYLFDPKLNPRGEINIIIPDRTAETIGLASIIASGIARKFDYRPVVFSVSTAVAPGYDNILIGDRAFADNFFDASGMKGPLVKILPLPAAGGTEDPAHALVAVSGLNRDHLKLAAETFAVMSAPFPETDEMTVTGLKMPDIPLYGGKGVIRADTKYTFKALNFPSRTFTGLNPSPAEISFRLPADFLIKQNLYAELSLHYSYGAAHRGDSVLNISLNGKLLRGIHLNDDRGGLVEGYKIDIPTHLFKPGDNYLRFEPVLTPLIGKNCEYLQVQNLFITIMDVSTIKFPPMPHYVDMPRMELFMLNGFPVTRWPDGHGAKIYLTNTDVETIETALNLVGMITQKNGHPLLEIEYTTKPPVKDKSELIVIGDIATMPQNLKELAPLALTKEMAFPYPVVHGWTEDSSFAFSRQISGLSPGRGALMEFQSPYAGGRTVLLLTACSSRELLSLSLALLDPGVQANIKGDLVLIDLDEPDKNIFAVDIGKKYFAGKAGLISRMDVFLFANPWAYYTALGLVIILLGLLVFYFLNKYRKKRIKGV